MKTQLEPENLVIGKHYLVKHRKGQKFVRRYYKGTEGRFKGQILCFVFSSKVDKRVNVLFDEKLKEFIMTSDYGVKFPNMEISIPFYDLISVLECND